MKKNLKKGLAVLALSGTVVGGTVMVSAQQTPQLEQVQRRGGGKGGHFGRPGGGIGIFGGRFLVEGSTITATFYDGNPDENANVLSTQTLNVGADSERSFANAVREAMQEAAFMVINTSEQSRTLELSTAEESQGRRGGLRAPLRGLNEGSTLTATFYDGNPEEGAAPTTSLSFTAGVDSELAFSNAFQEASSSAAYVSITTSPQERTIDLSQLRERFENRGGFPGRFQGPGTFSPVAPENVS